MTDTQRYIRTALLVGAGTTLGHLYDPGPYPLALKLIWIVGVSVGFHVFARKAVRWLLGG